MSSLWVLLDNYMVSKVSDLDDGLNPLFFGVEVVQGEQIDPDQANSPTVLVRSINAMDTGHDGYIGDGARHIEDIQYSYELIYWGTDAVLDVARAKAKDAVTQLRNAVIADVCLGGVGAADDGERVTRVVLGQRQVFIRGVHGQNQGHVYVAEGALSFTVYAEI